MQLVGDELLKLIPEGGTILTQCYGETIIGTLIRAARGSKSFRVYLRRDAPIYAGRQAHLSLLCRDGL